MALATAALLVINAFKERIPGDQGRHPGRLDGSGSEILAAPFKGNGDILAIDLGIKMLCTGYSTQGFIY